ncbi:MAG: helix-turn-helix domain-containing protein [Alphaproteobacteria bacterium]|nr:helix-turn-helix domain-containing protein [Alphaproteobacteria bacterium]
MSYIHAITAPQIKAARGLLEWGQDQLAHAAGLSAKTVRALENGGRSPRSLAAVRTALEAAGLEFINDSGVKRKENLIRILRGRNSGAQFLEAVTGVLKEATQEQRELLFVGRSLETLARSFGVQRFADRALGSLLAPLGPMRCVVSEEPSSPQLSAFWVGLSCRLTNENAIGSCPYMVFGNRTAQIHKEGCGALWFILFDDASVYAENRRHFLSLWNSASVLHPVKSVGQANRTPSLQKGYVVPSPQGAEQMAAEA